jgi:hypothetical protein
MMNMNRFMTRGVGERGAILVQVAISILALIAFTAFVADYGVLWVARGQAQNAADAGALAGAIGRAFDDVADPPAINGKAAESARHAALCAAQPTTCPSPATTTNPALTSTGWGVWPSQSGTNTAVEVNPAWPCPPGTPATAKCVEVNVYRDGDTKIGGGPNGSTPLPTFFGKIMNVTSQRIKATASAVAKSANTTNCMRPFAIADRWIERLTPGQYNRWIEVGGVATLVPGTPLGTRDEYVAPDANGLGGSGFKLPDDYGYKQTLIPAKNANEIEEMGMGWSLVVDLPDGAGGYLSGDANTDMIWQCIGRPVKVGQYLPTENAGTGQISHGFDTLKVQDPDATWIEGTPPSTGYIDKSCAPGNCTQVDDKGKVMSTKAFRPLSPRLVPIVVFDMDDFQKREASTPPNRSPCPTGGSCVRVASIIGYFAQSISGSTITGYLMTYPGTFTTGSPSVGDAAAFLKVIQLVR